MTTLNKVLIGLVLALFALGGVQYIALSKARSDLATEQAVTRTLRASIKATDAGLKSRAKVTAAATQAAAVRTEELQHATEANPSWADAVVPDAVWDSLYGPATSPAAR